MAEWQLFLQSVASLYYIAVVSRSSLSVAAICHETWGGPVPVTSSVLLSLIPLPVLRFFPPRGEGVTPPLKAALRAGLLAKR